MVVFGRRKIERAGSVLFRGELDQCREYVGELTQSDYDTLDICENDGRIAERIILYGEPVPEHKRNA